MSNMAPCRICSGPRRPSSGKHGEMIEDAVICFECVYWLEAALDDEPGGRRQDTYVVTPAWGHFVIGEENSNKFRGFGGAKVRVNWLTGRPPTESTNLWSQSTVPERFRHLFVVNGEIEWL